MGRVFVAGQDVKSQKFVVRMDFAALKTAYVLRMHKAAPTQSHAK